MQSCYACATPTFQGKALRFCTPVYVLKDHNSVMNDN